MASGLLLLGSLGNAAGITLSVVNGGIRRNPGDVVLWLVFGAFLVVGCLIVARRPGNRIGWIFTAVGLLTVTAGLAETYAYFALVTRPGSLPAPLLAAWILGWIWPPTLILMLVFPLLLFPTGHSLSPRWRPVTWLAAGVAVGPLCWERSAGPSRCRTGAGSTTPPAWPGSGSIRVRSPPS